MGHFIYEAIHSLIKNHIPTKESVSVKTIASFILRRPKNYRTKILYRQRDMFQNPRRKEL